MKRQYFIIPLLLLLSLCACNDDDDVQLSGDPIRLSGSISGMENDVAVTRFRGGAGVGMFIVNYPTTAVPETISLSKAQIRNQKYMQSADGLVGDKHAYWDRNTAIDVVAYYPYHKDVEIEPTAAVIAVAERQDTLLNNLPAYDESDFLWAKARAQAGTDPVQLPFKHLMSKVIVYLKSDAMIPGDMVGSRVMIQGMQTTAQVNLETGMTTPVGEIGSVVATEQVMDKTGYECAVKAIVVPQTVKRNTQLLEIQTLGGYSYTYRLPDDLTFETGKQVTLEVTIESGECHVTIGDITDWTESEPPVYGEAIENLPVFKVFDLYNLDGIQGMVVSTDETGKHGLVISFDGAELKWCTNITYQDETDVNDGMANMNTFMEIDPTLEDYPAMKWCMDKNTDGKMRWYLPASNEMMPFRNLLNDNPDLFNEKLQAAGGDKVTPISWDDWGDAAFWSSSLNFSGSVRCPRISSWSSSTTLLSYQGDTQNVRAFYKF